MTRRSRNLCRSGWAFSFLALALFLLGLIGAFHFHAPDADASSHACAVCLHLQGSAHAAPQAVSILFVLPPSHVAQIHDALSLPKAPWARLAVRAPPA